MRGFQIRSSHLFVATLLSLGVALSVVFWFPPAEHSFYPKCVLFQCTGLYCPGCGGLRATHHLVHGRFLDACRMNVLCTLFLPGLFLVLAWQKWVIDPNKPWLQLIAKPFICWMIAFAVIGFAVARNIPIEPFSWLAPH